MRISTLIVNLDACGDLKVDHQLMIGHLSVPDALSFLKLISPTGCPPKLMEPPHEWLQKVVWERGFQCQRPSAFDELLAV
jgi:hypothetical protein